MYSSCSEVDPFYFISFNFSPSKPTVQPSWVIYNSKTLSELRITKTGVEVNFSLIIKANMESTLLHHITIFCSSDNKNSVPQILFLRLVLTSSHSLFIYVNSFSTYCESQESWMIKRLHFFILIYNLFLVTLSILTAGVGHVLASKYSPPANYTLYSLPIISFNYL